MTAENRAAHLRDLMSREEVIIAPGVYDAVTARLVENAGFKAIYVSGGGMSASMGFPDLGLVAGSELWTHLRYICAATTAPIIVDADTGYGSGAILARTVAEFERAGVAGLHIEDQVYPKRCGAMQGKALVSTDDMARRVRIATESKSDPNFIIIARTDAVMIEGLDSAIERGKAYREAGADMLFIESLKTPAEAEKVANAFSGSVPLLFNYPPMKEPFPLNALQVGEMGYKLVIFAPLGLFVVIRAVQEAMTQLKEDPSYVSVQNKMVSIRGSGEAVDIHTWLELERRYAVETA